MKRGVIENFRWHDLRHAWASWHRQSGAPSHALQHLGGWRSSVMVERYAHPSPDHLAKAAYRIDALIGGYDLGVAPFRRAVSVDLTYSQIPPAKPGAWYGERLKGAHEIVSRRWRLTP